MLVEKKIEQNTVIVYTNSCNLTLICLVTAQKHKVVQKYNLSRYPV